MLITNRTIQSSLFLLTALICICPALAGPPLLCQEVDAGPGASLAWRSGAFGIDPAMTPDRVVTDTLALLDGERGVLARMETMRRATVYLSDLASGHRPAILRDRKLEEAARLLADVVARSATKGGGALALFDAGYLAACYAQAGLPEALDSYALVTQAIASRPEPEMELAAALLCIDPARPEREAHLMRALAGAPEGSRLARNIEAHAARWGWGSLAQLRSRLSAPASRS